MRFALFDLPALIRGRCQVAFGFRSLGSWFQMTTVVAIVGIALLAHPSQMRFAIFDSPALIRGRCQVAFGFRSLDSWFR
jgi:hypothetical protein